ncbi:hypothetical protein B7R76_05970 [Mageeibacillus indolicus]|uniref:Uncharacterized protein n=1 Tax=Mageeibacillus indolicus TaxID=884684 RepID=A0A2J8B0V2_9FIRM|nr:hypothetical protein B7R76_05970 [Mageeibacillus indolicus]
MSILGNRRQAITSPKLALMSLARLCGSSSICRPVFPVLALEVGGRWRDQLGAEAKAKTEAEVKAKAKAEAACCE